MTTKQTVWYHKPWMWGLLGGIAFNVATNGGHIGCCHTVGSVALGSLKLGVAGALAGGALGYVISKMVGPFERYNRTAFDKVMNVFGAAGVGLLGMVAVVKLEKMYFRYCMRRGRNIDLTKMSPVSS